MHLDELWPGVTDIPWVAFAIYLVVIGILSNISIHPGAVIASIVVVPSIRSTIAAPDDDCGATPQPSAATTSSMTRSLSSSRSLIGVAPGQFIAIVASTTQLSESLAACQPRLVFGKLGERLWISPRFHAAPQHRNRT